MLNLKSVYLRVAVGNVLLMASSGCAGLGMGTLADVLSEAGGLYGREVSGEIRQIDTRRQEIQLGSTRSGIDRVRYDGRTTVVAGQRRYDIRDLRRGDRVRILVDSQDGRGEVYARRIELEQYLSRGDSRRDDRRDLVRLEGNVVRVDGRNERFDLQQGRSSVISITLSDQASRDVRERVRGLRRGQRVRIEVEMISGSRARLFRFL